MTTFDLENIFMWIKFIQNYICIKNKIKPNEDYNKM